MFLRFGSKYDASLALRVGRVTPVSNRATQGDATMSQPISDDKKYVGVGSLLTRRLAHESWP